MTTQTRIQELEKEIERRVKRNIYFIESSDVDILKAELLGRKEERQATAREILEAIKKEQPVWTRVRENHLIKEIKRIGGLE